LTEALEPVVATAPDQKVVDGALRCIARWGVGKTTLDDIARESGCSRATVYRLFPGGKQSLLLVIGQREVARLLLAVTDAIDAAPDLEMMLVGAIITTARFMNGNDALMMMMAHEPELLMPFLAFDRLDPILDVAAAFIGPLVARFVDAQTAAEVVEWSARLVLSYTCEPSVTMDLTDPACAGRLVTRYLLPGIRAATTLPGSSLPRSVLPHPISDPSHL
jgi:AcrR family transcriptional regulator